MEIQHILGLKRLIETGKDNLYWTEKAMQDDTQESWDNVIAEATRYLEESPAEVPVNVTEHTPVINENLEAEELLQSIQELSQFW